MDDGSLFYGPSGTRAGPQGGGGNEPGDCGGAADQPVVRFQVDEAQARNGLAGPGSDRRLQTPHALGRERRLATGAHRRRAVHTARLVG